MEKPYVISAELDLATADLEQIVKRDSIEGFRESLDADLRAMGKETLWVPSNPIRTGLQKAITRTNLPVLSLDDRYVSSADQYLGISRGIDPLLNDEGYVARCGYPTIENQLRRTYKLGGEVMLVDDVLFSGEMVAWLADALKPYGVKIGAVVVGIAIAEGIEKLEAEGIEVCALSVFDEVEDEICERDFAIVPGSGRRIDALAVNSLYFDTQNGRPEKWASITPDAANTFCVNSLCRSMGLLQPDVSMQTLGKFFGYGPEGNAIDQIARRMEKI